MGHEGAGRLWAYSEHRCRKWHPSRAQATDGKQPDQDYAAWTMAIRTLLATLGVTFGLALSVVTQAAVFAAAVERWQRHRRTLAARVKRVATEGRPAAAV